MRALATHRPVSASAGSSGITLLLRRGERSLGGAAVSALRIEGNSNPSRRSVRLRICGTQISPRARRTGHRAGRVSQRPDRRNTPLQLAAGRYRAPTWRHLPADEAQRQETNVFSQEIKDLTPGRMYSLKMITADHRTWSRKIRQENERDLDPSRQRRVIHRFEAELPVHLPELLRPPPRQVRCPVQLLDELPLAVFKANQTTAKLTVTDWQDDSSRGGRSAGADVQLH